MIRCWGEEALQGNNSEGAVKDDLTLVGAKRGGGGDR